MIKSWGPGALTSYAAIRGRVEFDGRIFFRELVSALVLDTSPRDSVLGRVLRDNSYFLAVGQVSAQKRETPREAEPSIPFSSIAPEMERFAEQERVRTVGERHLARLLVELGTNNAWGFMSLNPTPVYRRVRELELGPDFSEADLKGWHGLIDTNVVLKARDPVWRMNWREVSHSFAGEPVTIWISTVTLRELDSFPLRHREPDLRRKASAFAAWFGTNVRTRGDLREVAIGNGVRFKFWKAEEAETADTKFSSRRKAYGTKAYGSS